MTRYHATPNGLVPFTAEEETARDALVKKEADLAPTYKLNSIRILRDERLKSTDYMANSDYTMPNYIKTWRQTLRDLPQNNTTESQYDTLLATDANGNLTNSVWKQPTE